MLCYVNVRTRNRRTTNDNQANMTEREMIGIEVTKTTPERDTLRSYQRDITIFCAGIITDAGIDLTEGWAQFGFSGDQSKIFTCKADPTFLEPILNHLKTTKTLSASDGTVIEIKADKMAAKKENVRRTDSPWCDVNIPAQADIPAESIIRAIAAKFRQHNMTVDLDQSKQCLDKSTMTLKNEVHIVFDPVPHYFTAHDLQYLNVIPYTQDGHNLSLRPRFARSFLGHLKICPGCLKTLQMCLCSTKAPSAGSKRPAKSNMAEMIAAQRKRSGGAGSSSMQM